MRAAVRRDHEIIVDELRAIEPWSWEAGAGRAVIYECVGVPGIIQQPMRDAPRNAWIVVVGVCMQEDRFKRGLEGAGDAFETLAHPEGHAKILVELSAEPWSTPRARKPQARNH